MKRILACLTAALFAFGVNAATLLPIQLLNPVGSTSGQTIVSTGASTAPAWGGVPVSGLAAIAANTVLANATGSSAAPTAFAMPSCTGATNALGYTSGTGIICNSAINAATLGGATFASPPATGYGSTTPEPVFATTLSASGNDALLYYAANAQSIPSGTSTTITSYIKISDRINANFNAVTGTFTAPSTGDYQVSGQLTFSSGVGVVASQFSAVFLVNGSAYSVTPSFFQESTSTVAVTVPFSVVIHMTAAQTLLLQAFQNTGSARTITGTAGLLYLSINRIP